MKTLDKYTIHGDNLYIENDTTREYVHVEVIIKDIQQDTAVFMLNRAELIELLKEED